MMIISWHYRSTTSQSFKLTLLPLFLMWHSRFLPSVAIVAHSYPANSSAPIDWYTVLLRAHATMTFRELRSCETAVISSQQEVSVGIGSRTYQRGGLVVVT